ncbi:MAG: hypothetical protein H7Z12_07825 [Rhodospirillaceae bacterium]|nr:hypothetical protein [Rhodospirillales bacterium]
MKSWLYDVVRGPQGENSEEFMARMGREIERLILVEERFNLSVTMAGVAVFRVGRNLRYDWACNPQFYESGEALVGKSNSELFMPEEAALLDSLFSQAFDSGLPQTFDMRFRCLTTQRELLLEILLDPVLGQDGQISELSGAAIDLSRDISSHYRFMDARVRADDARIQADDVRTQASDARAQADDARTQADDARIKARDVRLMAEHKRIQAQDARAVAEDERIQASDARAMADDARAQADDARTQADDARVQADDVRTKAKDVRTQATDARVQANDARAIAEDERTQADDARAMADDARAQADDARMQADDVRTMAKDVRTQASDARAQAEQERIQAKDARALADDARTQANDARTQANDARTQASDARTQASDARAVAEDARAHATDARALAEDARTQASDARALAEGALALAEEANRAKTRLMASAGHDLRQPLQAITFLQSMIQQRLQIYGDDAGLEAADAIGRAISSAEELLTSLTSLGTLDAGEVAVHVGECSAEDVVNRNVSEFRGIAEQKGLKLRVRPCAEMIRSDPVLLKRIIRNLTINAIKYTDRGGVLVGCRRRGRFLRIEVWDTGKGIPEDKISLVFDEFYRGDDAKDPGGGLGIGLSIVTRMAHLLGHEIIVRSREGKGSLFAVTVPLA